MRRIMRAYAGAFAKTVPFREYSVTDHELGFGSFFIPAPVTLSQKKSRATPVQSHSIPCNPIYRNNYTVIRKNNENNLSITKMNQFKE